MPTTQPGYDPTFLGERLPFPSFSKKICAPLIHQSGHEIKYIHYSGFVHQQRKMPLITGVNIKGEAYNAPGRADNEPWDFSDQIDEKFQLDNSFYGNDSNTFDRGHLVRRVDPCWGDDEDLADQAEAETFRWSNCTPQHKKLNQRGGVWYQLEQHVMEHGVKNKIANVSVFAGPVFAENDKAFLVQRGKLKGQQIPIPTEFWKVIVWKKTNGKFYAVGFVMSQWEFIKNKVRSMPVGRMVKARAPKPPLADAYFETLKFADHKTYQVAVSAIEKKTGIKFDWVNVEFPYRARRAKVIKAKALKKPFVFSSLYYKMKQLRTSDKRVDSKILAKRSLIAEQKPLSKAQMNAASKKGFRAAIKSLELQNVTL